MSFRNAYVYIHLKCPTFEVLVLEIQQFFQSWVENIGFAIFNVSDRENPPLLNVTICNSIRPSIPVLGRETWTSLITMKTSFTFEAESCKNFKTIFLETLFFKSSTSNTYISESFTLRGLGEFSIDKKLYLVLGSGTQPQKWELFKCAYIYLKCTVTTQWSSVWLFFSF